MARQHHRLKGHELKETPEIVCHILYTYTIHIHKLYVYTSHILYDYTSIYMFTYSWIPALQFGDIVQCAMGLAKQHSGKESACQCRRCKRYRFNPGPGRSPGVGNGKPLLYSCWENSVGREATKSRTQLSDCAHAHTHTKCGIHIQVLFIVVTHFHFS